MTPKGKKTGKGRRNAAAQRMDEAFAEIRELRAWVLALRAEVERLDARIGVVDSRTSPMEVIGPATWPTDPPRPSTGTPMPTNPIVTC